MAMLDVLCIITTLPSFIWIGHGLPKQLFEDSEVNPGVDYGLVGNPVNTTPYPAAQPEYFNHNMIAFL